MEEAAMTSLLTRAFGRQLIRRRESHGQQIWRLREAFCLFCKQIKIFAYFIGRSEICRGYFSGPSRRNSSLHNGLLHCAKTARFLIPIGTAATAAIGTISP
jgi:hypothetical protein